MWCIGGKDLGSLENVVPDKQSTTFITIQRVDYCLGVEGGCEMREGEEAGQRMGE